MSYHWNGYTTIGLVLIIYGILILLFPPKFESNMFGISTKMTMKNKDIWLHGQKLLAYALLAMGFIYIILSILQLLVIIQYWVLVILFMVFWVLTKFSINKILSKKYPKE